MAAIVVSPVAPLDCRSSAKRLLAAPCVAPSYLAGSPCANYPVRQGLANRMPGSDLAGFARDQKHGRVSRTRRVANVQRITPGAGPAARSSLGLSSGRRQPSGRPGSPCALIGDF